MEPDYLQYLRKLIKLEHEAKGKVLVIEANIWVMEELQDATVCCDQVGKLRQRFERGSIEPNDYIDTIDVLHQTFLPDTDNMPDEELRQEDESLDGVVSEVLEKVREKQKGKGKAKAKLKKVRKDSEEQDGSSDGAYETF
ncbi:hypothetical protein DFH08DRAFT_974429 [Mycena albidolilacea]|uniref:Uncharacterized protein n=1 Tax=Mycena albidolilacea TaxID=1033008 RepID=A0AAD6Z760_9AGAR|nr:hypothetical protein DFH08DRAFT_974429 [Mycena albidolilacea]